MGASEIDHDVQWSGVRFDSFRGRKRIFAGTFSGVEGLIGAGEQFLGAIAYFVLLPSRRESDGDLVVLPGNFQGTKTSQDKLQLLESTFGEKNKKLIATQADGEIGSADHLVEMGGKFLEDVVSGGMAVLVVDLLEFIQVEGEHGEGMPAALGTSNLGSEALHSETAVIKTGQRVDHGQIAKNVGVALLFSELAAQALDKNLLVDGVEVKEHDRDNQAKNSVINFDVEERLISLMKGRKSERDNGKCEEKHNEDGVAPSPPVALLNLAKFASEVVISGLRGGRSWAGLGVGHRVAMNIRYSVLNLS